MTNGSLNSSTDTSRSYLFDGGLPPDEAAHPAPFVPRELIAGRAIASLWPIAPGLGVWRPKWVR